jgi:hypothetical protein
MFTNSLTSPDPLIFFCTSSDDAQACISTTTVFPLCCPGMQKLLLKIHYTCLNSAFLEPSISLKILYPAQVGSLFYSSQWWLQSLGSHWVPVLILILSAYEKWPMLWRRFKISKHEPLPLPSEYPCAFPHLFIPIAQLSNILFLRGLHLVINPGPCLIIKCLLCP